MSLSNIFDWLKPQRTTGKTNRRGGGRRHGSFRANLERLEDRRLMTAVTMNFGGNYSFNSLAGVGFERNTIAALYASVDGKPDTNRDHFKVEIDWGEKKEDGELVYVSNNGKQAQFLIKGSHTYDTAGITYGTTITVTGPGGAKFTGPGSRISVSAMPSGFAGTDPSDSKGDGEPANVQVGLGQVGNLRVNAGVNFLGMPVASMYASLDGKPDASLGAGHVKINWGDGTDWSDGELVYQSSNATRAQYLVLGSHKYERPGANYPIVVYGIGKDGTSFTNAVCYATADASPGISMGMLTPDVWTAGQHGYLGTIAVEGGSNGYQNLQVTGLPAGLGAVVTTLIPSRDSSTIQRGAILVSGTPTQAGTFVVGVSLQDGSGHWATGTEILNVNSSITLGSLAPTRWGVNKAGYRGTISIDGGSGHYTNLQVSGLPAGLSASLAGNAIEISGTPIQSGAFNIGVAIRDTVGASAASSSSLLVTASTLTVTPPALPNTTAGERLSHSLSAVGGSGQYTFTRIAGALPAGVTLTSGGLLSGTANIAGTYKFTVQATDVAVSGLKGTQAYTLTVSPTAMTSITITAPATATAGTAFRITVTAKDKFGNKYTGPVTLASSNGQAVSPSAMTLTSGTGSTNIVLTKAGAVTLTAHAGTGSGTSKTITVKPAAVYSVQLNAPETAPAGTGFNLTVKATDKFGNGVNGTVKLVTSDGQAVTPNSVAVKAGTGTSIVTLKGIGLVELTGMIGTVAGKSAGTLITAPAIDTSNLRFMLSAAFNVDPEIQKAAIDVFNELVPAATDHTKLQAAIYQITSKALHAGVDATKALLDKLMPKPAAGENGLGVATREVVHGGLKTTLDNLHQVLQGVLFNQQPPAVQFQTAIKAAKLTIDAAKKVGQYVMQNPEEALGKTIKFLEGKIEEIRSRPYYFAGDVLVNAALAELTGGLGAIAPANRTLAQLEEFGVQELAAGERMLATGAANRLEGQAKKLVGRIAMEADHDLERLLQGANNIAAELSKKINPENGRINCFLIAEQGINYFRYGRDAIKPVKNLMFENPEGYIKKVFGKDFTSRPSLLTGDQALRATSKPGAYGIIGYNWGGEIGHCVNWFNLNGKIIYLDFQAGRAYTAATLFAAYGQVVSPSVKFVNLTLAP